MEWCDAERDAGTHRDTWRRAETDGLETKGTAVQGSSRSRGSSGRSSIYSPRKPAEPFGALRSVNCSSGASVAQVSCTCRPLRTGVRRGDLKLQRTDFAKSGEHRAHLALVAQDPFQACRAAANYPRGLEGMLPAYIVAPSARCLPTAPGRGCLPTILFRALAAPACSF